jgi:large subunit ribosomal protein L3
MVGLIGKKVGMTQVFDEDGSLVPVTVLHVAPNTVIGERTVERDGYTAAVLGAFDKKESRTTKPVRGQFPEGVTPKRELLELRDFDGEYEIGGTVDLSLFAEALFVDVVAHTKGRGYQGVMKRHGFGGGRKTHGSKFHRENGSTGMAASPSKVIKGTKMAGRMGVRRQTVQNLRVVQVDPEKQTLIVRGGVPGANGGVVLIRNAKKKS